MIDFFIGIYKDKTNSLIVLEAIVFVFGILSVFFASRENILVYPTGLIATTITVYILLKDGLIGETIVNFYYSIMSIYGWYEWGKKENNKVALKISKTNLLEKIKGLGVFAITVVFIYGIYYVYDYEIEIDNHIEIFISGIFFTGMYYMAIKKIENWILWIIADLIAIPLYAYRGWGMLSLQFAIFTIMAINAYISWSKIFRAQNKTQ